MTRTLDIIATVPINLVTSLTGDEMVVFRAGAMIDCDGSGGNPDNDPDFQPDTTLHRDGKALNAYLEPFIVVPPLICQKTKGKVLGAFCLLEHTVSGAMCFAVVGDIGPHAKIGEISPAAAKQIGVDPNPRTGGESRSLIRYSIMVGVPALIAGRQYQLQPFGGNHG